MLWSLAPQCCFFVVMRAFDDTGRQCVSDDLLQELLDESTTESEINEGSQGEREPPAKQPRATRLRYVQLRVFELMNRTFADSIGMLALIALFPERIPF